MIETLRVKYRNLSSEEQEPSLTTLKNFNQLTTDTAHCTGWINESKVILQIISYMYFALICANPLIVIYSYFLCLLLTKYLSYMHVHSPEVELHFLPKYEYGVEFCKTLKGPVNVKFLMAPPS